MELSQTDRAEKRSQARKFMEDLLTHKLDVSDFHRLAGELDWHQVLALSGDHLVTPSLFVALRKAGLLDYLPQDPRDALAWIHQANEDRNRQLLRVWYELTRTLDQAGVSCLPLKGIALLHHGYCTEGDRVLADIDFLVGSTQLPEALQALSKAGYRQISNVNDPTSIDSDPEFNTLDPSDFRNRVHQAGYQLPVILPPDEEIVMELHYRIGDTDRGISQYMQPLANQLFSSGGQGPRSELLDRFLVAHTFYHSHIKDEAHATGALDLRHVMDIERFLFAGVDVAGALQHLRQHLVGSRDRAALASFVHLCAEIWPDTISVWKDPDSVELAGIRHYTGVRTHPFRARRAWWMAKMRRRSRFILAPGWLKSFYGDRSAAVLLLRLVRYVSIRFVQFIRRKR